MNNSKLSKRDSKQMDVIQLKLLQFLQWLNQNQKNLWMLLGITLFIAAIIGGWNYYQYKQVHTRQDLLGEVDHLFTQEEETAEKQRQELQTQLTALNTKIDADKTESPARKALQSEHAALEKRIEAIEPNHKESLERYLAFYNNHPKDAEGQRAAMAVVHLQIKNKQYKEARELLEKIMESSKDNYFYQFYARKMLVGLLEEQQDFTKALEQTELLLKVAREDKVPEALIIKGKLLLFAKKQQEAFEVFDKIIAEHNSSTEAQRARMIKSAWR